MKDRYYFKNVTVCYILASIFLAFGWGVFLIRLVLGVGFMRNTHGELEGIGTHALILIPTMGYAAWMMFRAQRPRLLAKRGIRLEAPISEVDESALSSWVTIRLPFTANGISYTARKMVVRGPSVGETAVILYDPQNPQRNDVIPPKTTGEQFVRSMKSDK